MDQLLNKIKALFRGRPFDILQIEITSRCNAHCIMCPKTHLSNWRSGDMDKKTFSAISRVFRLANYIHLQGWGEPLLHPELDDMIRRIKKEGRKCGFTTNGQLLSQDRIKGFLDLDVDVIAISMAGADEDMHESIRRGTNFKKIVEGASYIANERERLSLKRPELVLLFIMTPQNINQLPAFVELGADVGATRVVPNNVDFVPCKEIDDSRAFNRIDRAEEYAKLISRAKQKAEEKNIELRLYPLFPEEQEICEPDPLKNLYISFDGCVSPCTYLALPLDRIPIYRGGTTRYVPRTCFGNAGEEDILDIWQKEDYLHFRDIFKRRKRIAMLNLISRAFLGGVKGTGELPAPQECRGCYKLFGF